ncbi:MAG: O-antigen ligase family protein [Candidatus Omnitrophica bacterium]|nr:O-antigen ligase family protein [Candidatus Omnitrophota bacterium]
MEPRNIVFMEKINSLIRFTLYVMIFMFPIGKAWVEICFFVSLILLLIKRAFGRNLCIPASILNVPLIFYIAAGLLSVAASVHFGISLRAFFSKFLEGIVLFFIVIEVINKKAHLQMAVKAALCAAGFICLNGIMQYYVTGGYDFIYARQMIRDGITSTFNHPNDLAGYLLLALFLTAGVLAGGAKTISRAGKYTMKDARFLGLLCLFGFIALSVILTKSRAAYLGAVVGVIFLLFLVDKKALFILLLACAGLAIVYSFVPGRNLDLLRLAPDSIREMFQNRTKTYLDVVDMIKAGPVFGHGLNTFMRCFETYKNKTVWTGHMYAHNCYLQMAAEMGIFGLLTFLWVVFTLFRRALSALGRDRDETDFLMAGLLSGLLAFLSQSGLDTNFYSVQLNAAFWLITGILVSAYNIKTGQYGNR